MTSLRLTEDEYAALLKRRAMKPDGARLVAARRFGKLREDQLAAQLDAAVMPYQREFVFLPGRKFRFDFVMLPLCMKLGVEVDGQVHRIAGRFDSDREKFNLALADGWRVLRLGIDQVRSGEALLLIRGALLQSAIRTLKAPA